MKVLITFAVDAEFAPWRRRLSFVPVRLDDLTLYSSTVASIEVSVLLTGMGSHAAAKVMGIFMNGVGANHGFDFLISSGLAGGLRQQHRPGQVLVARELQAEKAHADLGSDRIMCDGFLVDQAGTCGAKIVNRFYTSEHVIVSAKEKEVLGKTADAVDMESFDIVKEGYAWGTRGVALRAVSDVVEEDLPLDFNRTVSSRNTVSVPRILSQLVQRPRSLPALWRFGRQSRLAAESLAHFLDNYIEALGRHAVNPQLQQVTGQ